MECVATIDGTCYFELPDRLTYDECITKCDEEGESTGMACPSTRAVLEQLTEVSRGEDSAPPVGNYRSAWARNKCPAASHLAHVRWRTVGYYVQVCNA